MCVRLGSPGGLHATYCCLYLTKHQRREKHDTPGKECRFFSGTSEARKEGRPDRMDRPAYSFSTFFLTRATRLVKRGSPRSDCRSSSLSIPIATFALNP